jgi:MoxR-like ATPase
VAELDRTVTRNQPVSEQIAAQIERDSAVLYAVRQEIGKIVVGQEELLDKLLLALLCNSHVLIEGVPGLAKTLSVTTLARTLQASYKRIQFTPDLLPADLTGTLIYNERTREFTPHRGPVFANIVLADEINRAPAKVQSALLEAMQERQVTLGDETHPLDDPFMVLATQNPIEQEGTYPLPEAQTDRFMLKLQVSYPTKEQEREILRRMARNALELEVQPVVSPDEVRTLRGHVDTVYLDDKIVDYIVEIIDASRNPAAYGIDLEQIVQYGASPRATIYLTLAAKAHALLRGRVYVTPLDVKQMAGDVLRHRIIISYEGEAEGITSEDVIERILDTIAVP